MSRWAWIPFSLCIALIVGCGGSDNDPVPTPVAIDISAVQLVDNRVYHERVGEFRCSDGTMAEEKRLNLSGTTTVYGVDGSGKTKDAHQVIVRACVRKSLDNFLAQDVQILPVWTGEGNPSATQLIEAWMPIVGPAIADYLSGSIIEGVGEPFVLDLSWNPASG